MAEILGGIAIVVYGLQSIFDSRILLFGILSLCLVGALLKRNRPVATLCGCCLLVHLLSDYTTLGQFWPAPVVISSIFGMLLLSFLEKGFWLKRITFEFKWLLGAVLLGLIASAIVGAWVFWAHITPDKILFKIDMHLSGLAVGALVFGFAIFNSFSEEFLFRGPILEGKVWSPALMNITQAIAFGMFHFKGFPFGWSGSILAFLFALLQGYLRIKSKNFYYIWISHFVANLGMGFILFYLSMTISH